jgi:hypothetical protein
MGSRWTWPEIQQSEHYRGRWVALDNCRYDVRTAQPIEGSVVDADEDLVELCTRIRQNETRYCAILFCGEPEVEPPSSRPPSVVPSPPTRPSRSYTH